MNRLVFNTFSVPAGNSYELENSYAAFSWQRAAVLGPVKLDQTETAKLYAQQSDDDDDRTKESGLDASTGSLQEQREPAPRLGPRHPHLLDAKVVAHRFCITHREPGRTIIHGDLETL